MRTGSVTPLRRVYRALYSLSIRVIVFSFSRERSTLCLLYTSPTLACWNPGISDIDVIAVVRIEKEQDRRSVLSRLLRRYRALRCFFPHFCEFEIVDENSLREIGRAVLGPMSTVKTYEIANFRCSRDVLSKLQALGGDGDSEISKEDHIRNALLRYINFFLPRSVASWKTSNHVDLISQHHIAAKLSDLLARCRDREFPGRSTVSSPETIFEATLFSLEGTAETAQAVSGSKARTLGPIRQEQEELRPYIEDVAGFLKGHGSDGIDVVIWRESHLKMMWSMAFVVRTRSGGLITLGRLREFLSDLRLDPRLFVLNPHQWIHDAPHPLVLTSSAWRLWQIYYPLNAYYLGRPENLAFSTGGLTVMEPSRADYERFARVQTGVWSTNLNRFTDQECQKSREYLLEVAELARVTHGLILGDFIDVDSDWSPPSLGLEEAEKLCTERLAALSQALRIDIG